ILERPRPKVADTRQLITLMRKTWPSWWKTCSPPHSIILGTIAATTSVKRMKANELWTVFQPKRTASDNGRPLGLGIQSSCRGGYTIRPVSYTHLRAHETPEHLVC